ncbi:isopentenyl-diphosphate Delta-isomerase [Phycicoccus endophyticus]|uniref:Isopentenyl-diphosphate Delta-isomerase n=2 Tax=Phycicoccus endophyticus TaxID=1690220 RepID=A0A7G9R653_9MICO|nr:isopentenyl-diphosphate Delta-isomerase [Phycicoccus endophyticus]
MVLSRDPVRLVARDRAARRPDLGWVADDPVVLVDDAGAPTGSAAKSAVHHDDSPLHLGFSCYVLDAEGRLLVTTRAASKPSFPGVETNTVCGHPRPGEPLEDAVRRRARDELGLELTHVRLVLPGFRYRARMAGVVEHEVCPVLVARAAGPARPDPTEVDEVRWVPWAAFAADVRAGRRAVSPWCAEQVPLLDALGEDPRSWPVADPAELPAAARVGDPVGAG